jgi:hypothetical protein
VDEIFRRTYAIKNLNKSKIIEGKKFDWSGDLK